MKLVNIRKIYHNKHNTVEALKDIHLEFSSCGLTVILGPSGCGKTTLLNILSGNDKSFEGEIIDTLRIAYLTQEVRLFESMSVYENLKIIKDDPDNIEDYLIRYGLHEHKNKKLKKCSNGQKKRVQFICALLQNPELLLCDEPTAALDHDNAVALMEALKSVSKSLQVVVVTHDIALAEKYADRIIKMGKGVIESDTIVHPISNYITHSNFEKKTLKETFDLVCVNIKSRVFENMFLLSLLFVSILTIFSTFSLYFTIEKQTNIKEIFKNAENVIYSYPRKSEKVEEWEGKYYVDYDFYYYNDIVKVIEAYPEIIAVEAFYDDDTYLRSVTVDNMIYQNLIPNTFYSIEYNKYLDLNLHFFQLYNIPYDSAFFINDELNTKMQLYEEEQRTYRNGETQYFIDYEQVIDDYGFSFYDLVNTKDIPVLFGEMPKGNNEILLAKDTADLLLRYYKFDSYEEMIGKEITIGVYSRANLLADNPAIDYFFDDDDAHVREKIQLKIAGISNIENDYSYNVFFNSGFAQNAIISYFIQNHEDLFFDYVRFIVSPEVNVNELLDKINKSFVNDKSEFLVNDSIDIQIANYRNIGNLLIFGVSIIVIFFASIFSYYVFIRERFLKEQKILNDYKYLSILESALRIIILNTVAFIALLVFGQPLCDMVNQFAALLYYEAFLQLDVFIVLLAYFLVLGFNLVCEKVIGRKVK